MFTHVVAERLSFRDALFIDISFAVLTHLVCNRFEALVTRVVVPLVVLFPIIPLVLVLPYFSVPAAVVVAFGTYYATLLSSIVLYRLSPFHALARYPGPVHLKLSSLFAYGLGASGRRHLYIQKLHEHYNSEVVRIGPNELSFRDVSSIAQIMGTQGLTKGPAYDGRTSYSKNRPLIWKKRRWYGVLCSQGSTRSRRANPLLHSMP